MTLPSVVRIFFAIDLPQEVRDKLGQFICGLKKKSRTNAIRWSRPENLHITLQFLAEVNTEHLPLLTEKVKQHMEGMLKRSSLSFGALKLFPTHYRPRVIVVDITPQEPLAELSGLIGEGIKDAHYEIEKRPFRAHMTIGRIKSAQRVDLDFLLNVGDIGVDKIDVNEVVLFRSEPQADGSRYTALERLTL
jgi:2'-5' RNA ligase